MINSKNTKSVAGRKAVCRCLRNWRLSAWESAPPECRAYPEDVIWSHDIVRRGTAGAEGSEAPGTQSPGAFIWACADCEKEVLPC